MVRGHVIALISAMREELAADIELIDAHEVISAAGPYARMLVAGVMSAV